MDLEKVKEIAVKHQKAMLKELVLEVALVEIEKVVKESASKFDDILFASLVDKIKEAVAAY